MSLNIEVGLMPLETRYDIIQHTALRADEPGYNGFALPETWAYSVPVLLAELAVRTRQINPGSGILSIRGRSAATIAMTAATLQTISEGRFVPGLGASTPQLSEGLHDVPFEKPYTRLKETITQIRTLLSGIRLKISRPHCCWQRILTGKLLILGLRHLCEVSEFSHSVPEWSPVKIDSMKSIFMAMSERKFMTTFARNCSDGFSPISGFQLRFWRKSSQYKKR